MLQKKNAACFAGDEAKKMYLKEGHYDRQKEISTQETDFAVTC